MTTLKITNEKTYSQKVVDVDFNLSFNSGTFHGTVEIEIDGEGWRNYQGEHGARDYEDEFGFVISNDTDASESNTYRQFEKPLTAEQIRELQLSEYDSLWCSYLWDNDRDNYFLHINDDRKVSFANAHARKLTINKIKRMNLGMGYREPINSDEFEGLAQAGRMGENPFKCSIISR